MHACVGGGCVCACARVCAYALLCVRVRERKRVRGRTKERERERERESVLASAGVCHVIPRQSDHDYERACCMHAIEQTCGYEHARELGSCSMHTCQ